MRLPLLVVAAFSSLLACASKSAEPVSAPVPVRQFSIQGVVLDQSTIATGGSADPLAGVTVTLVSSDHMPPVVTDKIGSFVFSPVLQGDGLVLVFQKDGYATVTATVADLRSREADGGSADGASVTALLYKRSAGATVAGRIVGSAINGGFRPLAGASVTLLSADKLPAATTDANGFYAFTGVKQLSGLILSAEAPGFYMSYLGTFNIEPLSSGALPDGTTASPYYGASDLLLTAQLVVKGNVTDLSFTGSSQTRLPLAGVTVKLISPDNLPATTTDANGSFAFSVLTEGVLNGASWTLQFTKAGYTTDTTSFTVLGNVANAPNGVNCSNVTQGSGQIVPTCIFNDAMTRAPGALTGVVRFGANPAAGATVLLCTANSGCAGSSLLQQQTADAGGRFGFAELTLNASYDIGVLPWDHTGATSTATNYDTVFFKGTYGPFSGPNDPANVVINLSAPSKSGIVASSLVSSSPGYPVLVRPGAQLTGLIQDPAAAIFVQFSAPVDAALTSLELHQTNANGDVSPPLAIGVTWDRGLTATITHPALTPFADGPNAGVTYKLWITSFKWADGTVAIPPGTSDTTGTSFTQLVFSVYKLPVLLASPAPSIFLGNSSKIIAGKLRTPTTAVFDYDKSISSTPATPSTTSSTPTPTPPGTRTPASS